MIGGPSPDRSNAMVVPSFDFVMLIGFPPRTLLLSTDASVQRREEAEQPPVRPGTNCPRMGSPWLDFPPCNILRPRESDRCTYPVLPCRLQPSPGNKGSVPVSRHPLQAGDQFARLNCTAWW